jgi:hypothetical protein
MMTAKDRIQPAEKSTHVSDSLKKYGGESKMNTYRKTAIIVGVLFIIATVFYVIGQSIFDPILGSPDYLENAYQERMTMIAGSLLEFAGIVAILLIPAFLFPISRKFNEAFALGYAGFRFIEAMLLLIVEIGMLSLINVSQDYLNNGGTDASYFQILGSSIQSVNQWAFLISVSFIFPLGALMLYSVLYKSKLVPRFISAWGFIAAALLLTGSVLNMFGVFSEISESVLELILTTPIAINEMVLAIWLIVKGFNPSAFASESPNRNNRGVTAHSWSNYTPA